MLKSRLKLFSVKNYARFISEFKTVLTDCEPHVAPRQVYDPVACSKKDRGLVLGAYYNDNVEQDRTILTATAQRYNRKIDGRLQKLLSLAPTLRLGDVRIFYDIDPKYAFVALAGLGSECLAYSDAERMDESREAIRVAAGVGAAALQQLRPRALDIESFGDAEAAAEGAGLAVWQFNKFKNALHPTVAPRTSLYLYDDCDKTGWRKGLLKAESQNLVRYLQEMPANLLNPTKFAKLAVDLLCELDINVEIKTKGWAASHEMGGFVAIGESSVQPPLYVEISYFGADECKRPVVLIGKGVTFDSGSLDLRAGPQLRHMRGDMAGAACVLAVTRAAAQLRLPVNLRGILPLCEFMPNCRSPKFGDVVKNANGKFIRIRLPSREGRLLVADSLVYARNYWPQFILDVGTMSEELVHTLGGGACGCYSNCEELFRYAESASGHTGDRVWRLPLWQHYERRVLDSGAADVANTARRPAGESPACAAFLRQFVCDSRWLHLDTFNVAYTKGLDAPYLRRGMTGRPTRTLIELITRLVDDCKL